MIIAWDIETCPLPKNTFSEAQQRRYQRQLDMLLEREPDIDPDEASIKVRSLHPLLGFICAIGVVRFQNDELGTPHVYTAPLPKHEADMLCQFWNDIQKLPMVKWTTFNGKRFDCDWLAARTLAHHLTPTRQDILNRNPYQHRPHADLFNLVRHPITLDDLCDLLGVPSPKSDMDGSGVYEAIKAGRLNDVVEYCKRDVIATMTCFLAARSCFV